MKQLTFDDFIKPDLRPFLITFATGQGFKQTERVLFVKDNIKQETINWRKNNPNKYFIYLEATE